MSKACESSPPAKQAEGDVQVQFLLCKSCGLCAEYCPRGVMKPATEVPAEARTGPAMNPSGHVVYVAYDLENRCTGCGICAQVCPEGAVVVYRRKREARPAAPSPLAPLPEGEGKEDARSPLPPGSKGEGKEGSDA